MEVIDSQCHVSPVWYEPVESLLYQMQNSGVSQAVLIQMLGQTDNRYQQDCLSRFPGRFASVVWVEPTDPQALTGLRRLADEGATGVRLRPGARTAGPDPLAIWRCAEESGLAVSCVGNSAAFSSAEFAQLVGALPGLSIVLEHLGGTSQPDADPAAQAQRLRVMELARFPNVYLKVPGLGELSPRQAPPPATGSPFAAPTPEILRRALAAFGPERLMWGSDFPPVCAREGYGNALALLRESVVDLPQADRNELFANVARRVFKLPRLDSPVLAPMPADASRLPV
jgi:L-fuconolactonase